MISFSCDFLSTRPVNRTSPPSGVNLIAFSIRFLTARVTNPSSTGTGVSSPFIRTAMCRSERGSAKRSWASRQSCIRLAGLFCGSGPRASIRDMERRSSTSFLNWIVPSYTETKMLCCSGVIWIPEYFRRNSTPPMMEVIGVFSSWEAIPMKLFFTVLSRPSSMLARFTFCRFSLNSSWLR